MSNLFTPEDVILGFKGDTIMHGELNMYEMREAWTQWMGMPSAESSPLRFRLYYYKNDAVLSCEPRSWLMAWTLAEHMPDEFVQWLTIYRLTK